MIWWAWLLTIAICLVSLNLIARLMKAFNKLKDTVATLEKGHNDESLHNIYLASEIRGLTSRMNSLEAMRETFRAEHQQIQRQQIMDAQLAAIRKLVPIPKQEVKPPQSDSIDELMVERIT